MVSFLLYQEEAIKLIYSYKEMITKNFELSILILFITHTIACILVLPGAIFAITCGFIFGTYFNGSIIGYFLCVICFLFIHGTAGLVVFNISRLTIRNKLRELFIVKNEKLRKVDYILSRYGTKALFLFRLSPLVPVSIYNYLIGGFNSIYYYIIIQSHARFFSCLLLGLFLGKLFIVILAIPLLT